MAPFDRNTPLDARELDHINDHLDSDEFIILSLNLCIGTPSEYVAMQLMENADAPREMLNTWHSNQDPAKERRLLVKALNESSLCSLAETVRMGIWFTLPQSMRPIPLEPFNHHQHPTPPAQANELKLLEPFNHHQHPTPLTQAKKPKPKLLEPLHPSSALYPSCPYVHVRTPRPSKRTMHTRTSAGHDTYTSGALQPSSAPYPSRPSKRTRIQTLAGQETPGALQPSSAPYPSRPSKRPIPELLQSMIPISLEPVNNHQHPTTPAPTYVFLASTPQQPHRAPMQVPQQTSYEITEIKLRDVSIKLGCEWRTVGTYLGFGNSEIEVMQEEYRVLKECIFQMLLQWRNTNGVKATKEKFKKALRRSQREDLADFIDEADD